MAGDQRLIVQRLEGELLVYDPASDQAHCLGGGAAAEFEAAADDFSRREVIRNMALAAAAVAGGSALVRTVIVPAPAQAQSIGAAFGLCRASSSFPCDANLDCCGGICCPAGHCCADATSAFCLINSCAALSSCQTCT
jgi:hypothetical protein